MGFQMTMQMRKKMRAVEGNFMAMAMVSDRREGKARKNPTMGRRLLP